MGQESPTFEILDVSLFHERYIYYSSYWDPSYDQDLIDDRIAMNLIYVQVRSACVNALQGVVMLEGWCEGGVTIYIQVRSTCVNMCALESGGVGVGVGLLFR